MVASAALALAPAAAVAALALAPAPAAAQAGWDAPRMLGPASPLSPGAAWVQTDQHGVRARGVVASWRPPGWAPALGLRGGLLDGDGGDPVALAGLDVRLPVARRDEGAPADLSWSTGAGLAVGDFTRVTVPIDLSAGRSWAAGSVWFAPYLSGGVALDLDLGDARPDREFHLRPTAGAGLDLSLDRERRLVLRAALAVGDRRAFGLGAVVRL